LYKVLKQLLDTHLDVVTQEADRVTNKARKIGTTLRRIVPNLPRVDGAIFLTEESSKVRKLAGREIRGVRFYSLTEWKGAIGFDSSTKLTTQEVTMLGRTLEPKTAVAIDGSLRRLAGYVNLEFQSAKDERFHRIYKGIHSARQDRVVLHLYDLSASEEKTRRRKHAVNTMHFRGCNCMLGHPEF